MKDVIITTVLTIVIFIISLNANIGDAALENLIASIPVIIPTTFLWIKTPKNYLKFMSLKSSNISYQIDILIKDCELDKTHFIDIQSNIMDLDQSNKGKIMQQSFGEFKYYYSLYVDTSIIDISYDLYEHNLLITTNSKMKYNLFFKVAKNLLSEINKVFTNNKGVSYDASKLIAKIKIEFIDKTNEDSRNPFWNKLFHNFSNKIVDFRYLGNAGTNILISTNSIEFTSNDLDKLNKDINKELRFIRFKN